MIPTWLLPHRVTVQTGVPGTDVYGSAVDSWTSPAETVIDARVEMVPSATEHEQTNGRDAAVSVWRIFTNDPIGIRNRIVWAGPAGELTFDVDGPVAPVYAARTLHHYEANLRAVV